MTMIDRLQIEPPVDYPESDGSLIAESDWHRDEMFDLIYRLRTRYADREDVYVSGHMLVYFAEGDPECVFAPDVMVVFGVSRTPRRIYKLWEEKRAPAVVFEVSSRKTWLEDSGNKRAICEHLGIAEYWLWDPRYEYLTPPLQGHRLVNGTYRTLRANAAGCVASTVLGLRLCAEGNHLEAYDRATGRRLPRPGDIDADAKRSVAEAAAGAAVGRAREAEQAAREAERAARNALEAERAAREALEAERAAREALEAERAARLAAEAEAEQLRGEIARLRGEIDRPRN